MWKRLSQHFLVVVIVFYSSINAESPQNGATICEDGTKCENGSTCVDTTVRNQDTGINYFICDCSGISGITTYTGLHCEHEATDYCAFGAATAGKDSFCANGGKCKAIVGPDEDGSINHAGCECPSGFEGEFCQYRMGDTKLQKIKEGSSKLGDGSNKHPPRFTVILLTILVFVSMTVFVLALLYRRRIRQKQECQVEDATDELKFDDTRSIEIT